MYVNKVICHYPRKMEDFKVLKEKIALIHSEKVINYIANLPCDVSSKEKLLKAISKS